MSAITIAKATNPIMITTKSNVLNWKQNTKFSVPQAINLLGLDITTAHDTPISGINISTKNVDFNSTGFYPADIIAETISRGGQPVYNNKTITIHVAESFNDQPDLSAESRELARQNHTRKESKFSRIISNIKGFFA